MALLVASFDRRHKTYSFSCPSHYVLRYTIDLALHFRFATIKSNEEDAKVGAAKIESQEVAFFGAVGHGAHKRGQHFDCGLVG